MESPFRDVLSGNTIITRRHIPGARLGPTVWVTKLGKRDSHPQPLALYGTRFTQEEAAAAIDPQFRLDVARTLVSIPTQQQPWSHFAAFKQPQPNEPGSLREKKSEMDSPQLLQPDAPIRTGGLGQPSTGSQRITAPRQPRRSPTWPPINLRGPQTWMGRRAFPGLS